MPRFLALDADAGGLFVAAGGTARGAATVEQVLAAADEGGPLAPANAAARGAKLRDLLAAAAVKPAPLLLVVGRDRVILKDVTHPPTAPADEPAVVRFQASRDLSDAADDVVMDYLPLPPAADGQRRATAVFVRREVLVAARTLADAAGLKLLAVTPRPFTAPLVVGRAGATEPAAVVSAWPGGGEFAVVADGRVRYARPLAGPNPAAEVRRNLAVYAGQNPDATPATLLVAEGGTVLADALSASLGLPVRAFDPAAGLPGGDQLAPSLRGRLAAPLGLLALRTAGDHLPVNFAQPRAPRAEPGKNRGRVLVGALAAAVLLGGLGLFAYLEVDKATGRVADLAAQKLALQKRIDAAAPDVLKLKAADDFAAREVVVLDELFELASRVPDVRRVSVVDFKLTAKAAPPTRKAPPAPAGGAGTASSPPRVLPPAPPVAGLQVQFRSTDGAVVQQIVDSVRADGAFYTAVEKKQSSTAEGGTKAVQFVLTADVRHRPPTAYTRPIEAGRPVVPPAPAPPPALDLDGDR